MKRWWRRYLGVACRLGSPNINKEALAKEKEEKTLEWYGESHASIEAVASNARMICQLLRH